MKEESARLQRLINLLPWLVSNPDSSLDEVAQRFAVTRKQLLSDLVLLTMTGPDQFGGGLVDITYDDQFITVKDAKGLERPLGLRQIEITPLILGLKVLQKRLDAESSDEIDALIQKLTDLPGNTEADSRNLLIEPIPHDTNAALLVIKQALRDDVWLEFLYESADSIGISELRTVQPKEILVANSDVYLSAYDLSRNALRVFRISRMSGCTVISPMSSQPAVSSEPEPENRSTLVLTLLPQARHALEEFPTAEIEARGADALVAAFPLYSDQWAVQTTLSLAPWLIKVEPEAIDRQSRAALEEMMENHQT